MRSKKETILVVGNGVIGASLVYGMNNSPNYKIYLSRYKEGKVNKSKIFKQDIPTSASKSGGLSNLWHSVIDLKAIRLNDLKVKPVKISFWQRFYKKYHRRIYSIHTN